MLKQIIIALALSLGFNASAAKLILKSHYTGEVSINKHVYEEILSNETLAYTGLTDGQYQVKIGEVFQCTFAIKDNQDVRIDTRVIEGQTIRPIYNFLYRNIKETKLALEDYKKLVNSDELDGVYAEIDTALSDIESLNSIVSEGFAAEIKANAKSGRTRLIFASTGKYRTYKKLKHVKGDKYSGLRYSKAKKRWYKSSFKLHELYATDLIKFAKKNKSKSSKFLQVILQIQIKAYSKATDLVNSMETEHKKMFLAAIEDMKKGTAIFKIKEIKKPKFDLPYDFYDIIPDKTTGAIRDAMIAFYTWFKGRTNNTFFSKVFAKSHGAHKVIYLQAQPSFFESAKTSQNDYLMGMWHQWQQKLSHSGQLRGMDKVHIVVYTDKPMIFAVVHGVKGKMEATILR